MKTTLGLLLLLTSSSAFAASTVHEFSLPSIDGTPAPLSVYKGKVALIVNVASQCGYTPQYAGLEKLYEKYKDKGLVVLGFPANNFGAQEPGTNDEIKTFCETNYGVEFPLFEKIEVNGDGRHPLYEQLTAKADAEGNAGDIQWNFEKFLVSPEGDVVARFRPLVTPEDAVLTEAIESQLPT